ncbi:MAG: putative two-component system response regulator [Mariniblastus sp.]|jgi:putative two-component system response regulator
MDLIQHATFPEIGFDGTAPGLFDRSEPPQTLNNRLRASVDSMNVSQERDEIRSSKIMIVDDEALVIRVVRRFLSADGYENFHTLTDPREALEMIDREQPDVVLLDIMMPHITGLDLLKVRQKTPAFQHIPFIILSANSENQIKRDALQLGATDFLSKPVDPNDLILRVQNALTVKRHHDHLANYATELERQVRERTKQIEKSREQIIHCLARAAEYRDNETGQHVIRVGKYCSVVAAQLGFDAAYCREIELAAQLHDVGKIGIPDSVLLNPGKLTNEEFDVMKTHCDLGLQIMEPLAESDGERVRQHASVGGFIMDGVDSPMLELACSIARTHHEKFDGTGYPLKIKGEAIPIEGRICCVADVFDALCSERPYKPKFSMKKCLEIMLSERGTRFDPQVLDAFFDRIEDIEKIRQDHDDKNGVELIKGHKS